ncbi:MAG TPA: dienelactone hydrolase family protein [Burkholderiales bacterium]
MKEQEIRYQAGDVTCHGFVAYDEAASGKRPGVLVVHEWWGHNEHARGVARKLAQAGFVGFALDMYGEGKQAADPQTASELSGAIGKNLTLLRERVEAARTVLNQQPNVDPARTAAVGYCFGGMVVLQMARLGADLRGVVSFHGILPTGAVAPGTVRAKMLVLNGADDPFVPKEQVETFEKEMQAAGASCRVINYPGAKHAFTNPLADERGRKFNLPLAYNAEIDRKSWDEALAFLREVTK